MNTLLPFQSSKFEEAWNDWVSFRKEMRKPLTPTAIKIQLKKLSQWKEDAAIASIERSICNGWQGLFEAPDSQASARVIYSQPPRGC